LSGGRIVTESYFGSANENTTQDVASVQKSVISTLIGIARERGLLGLDDAVSKYLSAGWSRANSEHEAAVTLRHLMTHSSGLDPRTLRSVAPPGVMFDYNTPAYQKLRRVLEKVAGQDITSITRAWIFDKIAAPQTTFWRLRPNTPPDPVGDPAWGLVMNAREMARFGLLASRRGRWGATAVVKATWFDEAWAPSQAEKDYGLLWWLMANRYERAPGIPSDWQAALGAGDQKIYAVPSLDLVVTRQGAPAAEASDTYSSFDLALFRAIAAARA
jgi:CubicO group peptidase (beta-lactamase class C family)